jgi:hypothetical protein
MITKAKIEIYKKYKGDGDMFVRCMTKSEQNIMGKDDFRLIDDLLQNIEIVNKGLASLTFKNKLTSDFMDKVEPDCIDLLTLLTSKR